MNDGACTAASSLTVRVTIEMRGGRKLVIREVLLLTGLRRIWQEVFSDLGISVVFL